MEKTNTDKYADDTHEYGKDINADLKRFEKHIYKWTYQTVRWLNPSYSESYRKIVQFNGALGLTFDDIKQEMMIVVWNVFRKYNERTYDLKIVPFSVGHYIGMINRELEYKAIEISRSSNTLRQGKGNIHLNGPQADYYFYGLLADWKE